LSTGRSRRRRIAPGTTRSPRSAPDIEPRIAFRGSRAISNAPRRRPESPGANPVSGWTTGSGPMPTSQ
jgi:hypothetical protein